MKSIILDQIITNDTVNFLKAERNKLQSESEVQYKIEQAHFNSLKEECKGKIKELIEFKNYNITISEYNLVFAVSDGKYSSEIKITKSDSYDFLLKRREPVYELNYSSLTLKLSEPSYGFDYIKLLAEVTEKHAKLIELYKEVFIEFDKFPLRKTLDNNYKKIQTLQGLIDKEVNEIIQKRYESLLTKDKIEVNPNTEFFPSECRLYENYGFQITYNRTKITNISMIGVVKRNAKTVTLDFIIERIDGNVYKQTESFKTDVYEDIIKQVNKWNNYKALNETFDSIGRHYEKFKENLKYSNN